MFESIELLSKKMNVTGSEDALISYLQEELSGIGDTFVDPMGSLVITVNGNHPTPKNVMVCISVDVPGFLCLHSEQREVTLVPTSPLKADVIQNRTTVSDKGIQIRLPEILKETSVISMKNSKVTLGDVFQFDEKIHRDEAFLRGFFASKYALISILKSLATEKMKHRVSFCFCTQGESRAKSEANLIRRFQPDSVLFLTDMESSEKFPLVLIRDGSVVSDPDLRRICFSNRTKSIPTVTETAVSKMETAPTLNRQSLALALPTANRNTVSQEVSILACKRFYRLVKEILQKI